MNSKYERIEAKIRNAADRFLHLLLTTDPQIESSVRSKGGKYLTINSSFLYRDRTYIKTNKSSRCLTLYIEEEKNGLEIKNIFIEDGINIIKHYKLKSNLNEAAVLNESIETEINQLGNVIYVLLATVYSMPSAEKNIQNRSIKAIRLNPDLRQSLMLKNSVLEIRRIIPIEDLLVEVERCLADQNIIFEQQLRHDISKTYDELLDEIVTKVKINRDFKSDKYDTLLGQIIKSLIYQSNEYRLALEKYETDESTNYLNDILRIAYNFSTDILPLIFLFMSICDLKPLLFWSTLDSHWNLYQSFEGLPWSSIGKKENIKSYQDIVAAARNHAFHHVFPFETTIEVDLSSLNVKARKLLLFPPYNKKAIGGVQLEDQDLINVFKEFSRAKNRPVSFFFWKSNFQVMKATIDLAEEVLTTLLLLYRL